MCAKCQKKTHPGGDGAQEMRAALLRIAHVQRAFPAPDNGEFVRISDVRIMPPSE